VEDLNMIRRGLPTLMLAGLVLSLAWTADPPGPAPSREEVLKQFAKELVSLTPGMGKFPAAFTMGSDDKDAPATAKPPQKITFKHPFAISSYEVTQELYQYVMDKNPSKWKGRRNAVETVSWEEATEFCKKLTAELRKTKLIEDNEVIRLPSEAEWEYACRAGSTTRWSFGDKVEDLADHAWFKGNAKGFDPPVGKKKANPWGLYDMHGYVWEWCADAWSATHAGAAADGSPRVSETVKDRVIRGGSWGDDAEQTESTARSGAGHDYRDDRLGFRCVKAKEESK
jgi:formylglycine-generating enzyme required for sulfatase activity